MRHAVTARDIATLAAEADAADVIASMSEEDAPTDATQTPASGSARARIALLCMVAIWALNFPIAKDALSSLTPLAFNGLRFPLAAAVVLAAARARGQLTRPDRRDVWKLLAFGLLGNLVYQLFFIYGLALSRAGTASLLLAGTPIITVLFTVAVGHEEVPRRVWLGATATFLGIGLVVFAGRVGIGGPTRDSLTGNLLMICATFSWATYTVGSRSLVQRYGSMQATAWMLSTGAVAVFALALPDLIALDYSRIVAKTWLAVVYAGALSIGLAYLCWHYGVRQIGNTRTAVYSNLVPVLALGAAWILLGEVPTAGQLAGATVIIGGVTLAQSR